MSDRRSFLSGLIGLPLVGGAVSLIGRPTAAAVPVTNDLLDAYSEFLHFERRALTLERFAHLGADYCRQADRIVPIGVLPADFHFGYRGGPAVALPSSRAAVILSAAGVPLAGSAR